MNTTSEPLLLTDLSESEASTIQGGSWRCYRVTPVYYYYYSVPYSPVSAGSSSGVTQNVNINIDD